MQNQVRRLRQRYRLQQPLLISAQLRVVLARPLPQLLFQILFLPISVLQVLCSGIVLYDLVACFLTLI